MMARTLFYLKCLKPIVKKIISTNANNYKMLLINYKKVRTAVSPIFQLLFFKSIINSGMTCSKFLSKPEKVFVVVKMIYFIYFVLKYLHAHFVAKPFILPSMIYSAYPSGGAGA